MLFSATFDGAVAELARAYTVNPSHVRGVLPAEAERGEIDHSFVAVTADDKLDRLVEHLRGERGLALVFVRTKHGADKLVRKLERQHDIRAVAMHGNLSQNQRERALAQFESGRVSTLVATDVAARGLDVDDITHVINFDPPQGDDDYVHRVGRTGRAGRSGTGVTFVLPEQRADVGRLAARLGHGERFVASGMAVSTRPVGRSGNNGHGGEGGSAGRKYPAGHVDRPAESHQRRGRRAAEGRHRAARGGRSRPQPARGAVGGGTDPAALRGRRRLQPRSRRPATVGQDDQAREQKAAKLERDESVLAETGIRVLREKPVFTTPNVFPPSEFEQGEVDDDPEFREVVEPQHCYVCKQHYRDIHPFYDQLCPPCARAQLRQAHRDRRPARAASRCSPAGA